MNFVPLDGYVMLIPLVYWTPIKLPQVLFVCKNETLFIF